MASDVKVQVAGLHRSNNPFSSASPGAQSRADNCVLNATNVMECRRGFDYVSYGFGASTDRARALAWYGSTLLVWYSDRFTAGGTTLCRDTGSAFTDYSGTFTCVDATLGRLRFATCAGNLYFNCSDGVRSLDAVASTPAQSGVPRPYYLNGINASANGWQTHNTAVAYRGVWGIVDANGNEKLGAPTGRFVLRNYVTSAIGGMVRTGAALVTVTTVGGAVVPHNLTTGDTVTLSPGEANFVAGAKVITVTGVNTFTYAEAGANVSSTVAAEFQETRAATLTLSVPSGISTSHFFRLYRSELSATAATDPGDELYLCYEAKPTGGEVAAGVLSATDICPESMLGDAAPWNSQNGYGLPQVNERPPIALDIVYWDNRLFYANCTQRHRFFLNLLGVGSPNGVQNTDTITIAGVTYTFATAAVPALPGVYAFTADTPALNIERTAKALVDAINTYSGSTLVRATYLSGPDDPPGQMMLEEIAIGGSSFSVAASRVLSWSPALTRSSDNNRKANSILFSKAGEPEAVPVVNEVLVGSQNDAILRIVPLKGTLIVFKQYEGIWAVTGSNGRYSAEKLGVANLLGYDTPQAFSDRIWCLTDQGETTITEGAGVSVTSYNIETDITQLFGDRLATVKRYSFGVAYESDRRYLLWTTTSSGGELYGAQAFNYSTSTKSFTKWTKAARCGGVNPVSGKLTLAAANTNQISIERKQFTCFDYADEVFTANALVATGTTVQLDTTAHGISLGDVLNTAAFGFSAGGAYPPYVTAVNGDTVTLSDTVGAAGVVAGTVNVYPAISNEVRWQPLTGGNPALKKMARQLSFIFGGFNCLAASAVFSSEEDATESTVALTAPVAPIFFTDSTVSLVRVAPLPKAHSEAAQLVVGFSSKQAFANFKLQGFVVDYDADTEKGGKR